MKRWQWITLRAAAVSFCAGYATLLIIVMPIGLYVQATSATRHPATPILDLLFFACLFLMAAAAVAAAAAVVPTIPTAARAVYDWVIGDEG